jgi:two-component system sensor histidine kinase/response regulator
MGSELIEQADESEGPASTGPGRSRSNILLVDDRRENLLALEAVLAPLHQNLVRAGSGEEALAELLRRDFAVILLDVHMPGLDGFQTAQLIRQRERNRTVPIIFITAVSHEREHHLRGYESGAVDYITKPFDPHMLRAKVAVFLELHEKTRLLAAQTAELRQRIRERDLAQRALARRTGELARSNTELDQFVQVVSHDLQEPLRTLIGFLTLLRERLADANDSEAHELSERALAGAERMRGLIQDLVRYSQEASTEVPQGSVSLADVLTDAMENLQAEITASGARVEADDLPPVRGDRWQLTQLLQNLLSNAIKFRNEGPPTIRVGAERRDDRWVISVEDGGIGIPRGQEGRIFTLFQRLHPLDRYPGTGLGLALCRKIVDRHGGTIWAEARPEGGSAFRFTLLDGEATGG